MDNHYWTHNVAYHPWILRHIQRGWRVLDVGAGDGLLLWKLAGRGAKVVGLEPDGAAAGKARERLLVAPNASVIQSTFEDYAAPPQSFDCVIFVASLHHMSHADGMRKAKELLAPGGLLLVVGLARPHSPLDWLVEVLRVLPAKLGSWLHKEAAGGTVGGPVAQPSLPLSEIRRITRQELPGASFHLGLYYRYLLRWKKPGV